MLHLRVNPVNGSYFRNGVAAFFTKSVDKCRFSSFMIMRIGPNAIRVNRVLGATETC